VNHAKDNYPQHLEASFSILAMSMASSAAMSMGLAPNPQTQTISTDKNMARFNIDLLLMLQEKTKGNLSSDEQKFIDAIVNDLQLKYLSMK
jgi:hypothetical protein